MKNHFILILITLLGLTNCTRPDPGSSPPNIIIVLADDLGYGDLSSFNPEGKIRTPHLDQMAAEGMRFTDAHSGSAVCTPTRYGLLTGRYAWRSRLKSGVLTGKSRALIPEDRTTMASLLKRADYHTAFIGKWHLGWNWGLKDTTDFGGGGWNPGDFDNLDFTRPVGHNPNDLGFDYAYGHAGSLDMAPYVYVENGRVTAQPDRVTVDTGKYTWWREGPTGADFMHEQVTPNFFTRAMEYAGQRSKNDQPFFLYLALPSPHTPILPTAGWQGRSGLNPYADFVVMIDDYMGQLQEVLEQNGLADNTLLIFTSDNGCSPEADFPLLDSLGHDPSAGFRGHKADIYEGGHRVPFIARWPGRIPAGSHADATICLTDLFATAADLVEIDMLDGEGEDSYSLVPLFDPAAASTFARKNTVHHSINGSFALRQGDWKLIFCPGSGGWSFPRPAQVAKTDTLPQWQLYNLATDPAETDNRYPREADRSADLRRVMQNLLERGRSTPGPPQANEVPDGEWKQIRAFSGN